MDSKNLKINSGPRGLNIVIKNDSSFNFFIIFMLTLMTWTHVFLVYFIFISIRNDMVFSLRVLFVISGLYGLWKTNKQLRYILIFINGNEEIKIDDDSAHYNGKFWILKNSLSLKLNQIKRFELVPLGEDKFSQSSNMFTKIKYGTIILEKSKRKKIEFGQSLDKQELESLFAEIEKKIKLPTRAKKT